MRTVIDVFELNKTFRVFSRREGFWGSVRDLFQREYRELAAVNGITFSVERGEVIGFIGPNGAGKSTTIKMLTGILKPSSGGMNVLGFEPYKDRRHYSANIGVVFGQRTQLWWDIAVVESFRLLAHIYGVSKSDYSARLKILSDTLQLEEVLHTPVRKLSLGQRLRCDLAASLIHNPRLLFLDEPTIGVDAVVKTNIRSFLRNINREFGTTIILTTHDLVEIEELCERIVIIDKGKLVYDGSLDAIRRLPGLEGRLSVDFLSPIDKKELEEVLGQGIAIAEEDFERSVTIRYDRDKVSTVDLVKRIVERYQLADLSIQEPEIEDILIRIYREGLG